MVFSRSRIHRISESYFNATVPTPVKLHNGNAPLHGGSQSLHKRGSSVDLHLKMNGPDSKPETPTRVKDLYAEETQSMRKSGVQEKVFEYGIFFGL